MSAPSKHEHDHDAGLSVSEGQDPTRVAAFIDVDGTLLSVHSGTRYAKFLKTRGLLGLRDQLRIVWAYVLYRTGLLDIAQLGRFASAWLKGREEAELVEGCAEWYEAELRRYLCPTVVAAVQEHQRLGHTVAILTAGTRYLNDLIAHDLGIEHVLATSLEVCEGRFTGDAQMPLCYGKGKIVYAKRLAEQCGLDLAQSYFYTDSISDLPVLEAVGHPRIVRPDPRLKREARRRKWLVLAEGTQSFAASGE